MVLRRQCHPVDEVAQLVQPPLHNVGVRRGIWLPLGLVLDSNHVLQKDDARPLPCRSETAKDPILLPDESVIQAPKTHQ